MTHYSIEDIAVAKTLPNLTILSPSDPIEAEICAEYAIKSKTPVYIRLAKSGESHIHKNKITDITNPIVIKEGEGVAVLFHGSISDEVMNGLKNLKENPIVISIPMIYPLNFISLSKNLENVHTVITVEEHFTEGGLGSIISDWITREKKYFRLIKLGIRNEFIHIIQDNKGMRKLYGISSNNIKSTIEKAFDDEN